MARPLLIALAAPAVALNPAERLVHLPIDDYAYDHAKGCGKQPMRCLKLERRNYSLHAEGRAIDWHLDVARAADRREARRLIDLWLATDSAGNPHALARRMGIQEIIWNCRSWWAEAQAMGPYSGCLDKRGRPLRRIDKTLGHRDHIHIGLSRAGARKRTSFWALRS